MPIAQRNVAICVRSSDVNIPSEHHRPFCFTPSHWHHIASHYPYQNWQLYPVEEKVINGTGPVCVVVMIKSITVIEFIGLPNIMPLLTMGSCFVTESWWSSCFLKVKRTCLSFNDDRCLLPVLVSNKTLFVCRPIEFIFKLTTHQHQS